MPPKGLRRLCKNIHIYKIKLDFIVANEDAYEAALGYGKANILVYNVIAFLHIFFNVNIDHVNITCGYNSSERI